MTTTLFTDGWSFRRAGETDSTPVRLPHDAMIAETRSGDAGTGNHGGYFPGGAYLYEKDWTVPADIDERRVQPLLRGRLRRHHRFAERRGRRDLRQRLSRVRGSARGPARLAATARIEVEVDNTQTPNSRWYTGSGIYRPVWLESVPATHIAR